MELEVYPIKPNMFDEKTPFKISLNPATTWLVLKSLFKKAFDAKKLIGAFALIKTIKNNKPIKDPPITKQYFTILLGFLITLVKIKTKT